MPTEKTITRETTTEKQPPVSETKTTTTTRTDTKPEPKPRIVEETVVVDEG